MLRYTLGELSLAKIFPQNCDGIQYKFKALNSTIHGIEILCQTAPHHGELSQANASYCLRLC